jgi:acyl carrier protein phosphodiesterase
MNYLAHAYLSFGDPELLVGNMISDFVKGKAQFDYPPRIQQGIRLHRAIDSFTDAHIATKEAADIFHAEYRLYSGAFIDIVYDHFIATDAGLFPGNRLESFAAEVYGQLEKYYHQFPPRFRQMFPYMQNQNWLVGYRSREGIYQSFGGLARRAKYIADIKPAFVLFEQHYEALLNCYRSFFPDVLELAASQLNPGK